MNPLYIFDLDGTLADCEHRRPYLLDYKDPQRWEKFFNACDEDTPIGPVLDTLFRLHEAGADIWIWSGRMGSDAVAERTLEWLDRHLHPAVGYRLRMREEKDYTPDETLKEGWLLHMNEDDRQRLVAVFDDRDKVVSMWRRNGVQCFQVAPGNFNRP